MVSVPRPFFFFFNDTATTEIYTLSLHDALPFSRWRSPLPLLHNRPAPTYSARPAAPAVLAARALRCRRARASNWRCQGLRRRKQSARDETRPSLATRDP